jgi:hypothetical protein
MFLFREYCESKECEFYLTLESIVQIENPNSLKLLIEQNRSVIAPLLLGPKRETANFSPNIELYPFIKYNCSLDETGNNVRRRSVN